MFLESFQTLLMCTQPTLQKGKLRHGAPTCLLRAAQGLAAEPGSEPSSQAVPLECYARHVLWFHRHTRPLVPPGPRGGKTWLPHVGRDYWRYPTAKAPPCPALFWAVVQHVSGQHTKLQSQKIGRTAALARRAGVSERQAGG